MQQERGQVIKIELSKLKLKEKMHSDVPDAHQQAFNTKIEKGQFYLILIECMRRGNIHLYHT